MDRFVLRTPAWTQRHGVPDRPPTKAESAAFHKKTLPPLDSPFFGHTCNNLPAIQTSNHFMNEYTKQPGHNKAWICCPACSYHSAHDARLNLIRYASYTNAEIAVHTEALQASAAVQGDIMRAYIREQADRIEQLKRTVSRLEDSVQHLLHLDDMRARDKANKRQRKEK